VTPKEDSPVAKLVNVSLLTTSVFQIIYHGTRWMQPCRNCEQLIPAASLARHSHLRFAVERDSRTSIRLDVEFHRSLLDASHQRLIDSLRKGHLKVATNVLRNHIESHRSRV